jgi:hypothetical protein
MEIQLVSSLTPDDESRLAPRLLDAIGVVMGGMDVSYSVRIETAVGKAIHHNHTAVSTDRADDTDVSPAVSDHSVSAGNVHLRRASPAKICKLP